MREDAGSSPQGCGDIEGAGGGMVDTNDGATTLAGEQGGPLAIVTDATSVYWVASSNSTIMKVGIG